MRTEIERVLKIPPSGDQDDLTRSAEWLGKRLDDEIEQVQLHESREQHM